MREFIQNGEYQKILFHGQQTPHNRLWIGIGYGDTPMEAKSRAAMALNHSIADRSGANYIAEDEHQFTEIKIDDRPITRRIFCTGFTSAAVRMKN